MTGLVYDVANWHLVDDKEAADRAGDHDEFYRLQGEIEDAQTIEWIFFGTGLAAVTTGVILLLLDDQPSDPDVALGLNPSTTGGAFSLSFDF